MSKTYEDEQAQLKVEIINLQKEVEVQERQIEDLEQFIQRAHRYTDLTELTPYALRELVKAVYVEAPDKLQFAPHGGHWCVCQRPPGGAQRPPSLRYFDRLNNNNVMLRCPLHNSVG